MLTNPELKGYIYRREGTKEYYQVLKTGKANECYPATAVISTYYWGSLDECIRKEGYPDTIGYENEFFVLVQKGTPPKVNKYNRVITDSSGNTLTVDVYDVIEAFGITCPAMQHAAKKVLCAGLRGHKDQETDLQDVIDSVARAKILLKYREKPFAEDN